VTVFTKPSKKPYLVGVSGGSGSGKTYFAQALQQRLGDGFCTIVYQDNFYRDQSSRFDFDGGSVNFDHPDSIDFELMAEKLLELKLGGAADIPVYDFVTHSRLSVTLRIPPCPVILIDGILIFHEPQVRDLFDDLIFFDTPEQLRFERRLKRDVSERGRKPEGVQQQFLNQVKPMHDRFVEPSKRFARIRAHDELGFEGLLANYVAHLRRIMAGEGPRP
jgi:uridine kinase